MMSDNIEILIVEDNPADIEVIKEMLSSQHINFTFLECNTIEDVKKFNNVPNADVVLLDLNLPDSMGLETLDKIVDVIHYSVPVIVFTSMSSSIGIEAIKRGAADFLIKGKFDGQMLMNSIFASIERKKQMSELKNIATRFNK